MAEALITSINNSDKGNIYRWETIHSPLLHMRTYRNGVFSIGYSLKDPEIQVYFAVFAI